MSQFAGMVSETSVSFTGIDGGNNVISTGHPNNERIRDLMRKTRAAFTSGDTEEGRRLWQELTDAADIPAAINRSTSSRVTVVNGDVMFDGELMHNSITRRILWSMSQDYDPQPYMAFLDNLMDNPSNRAVNELFDFMEACDMGVTDDGYLIAYKRVRDDYMDIHSGTISNAVGEKPSMRRNAVDDDKDRTCSNGLHFCSFKYLPSFGSGPGNRVVILKINPRDVVSIPSDYANAKGRACLYEVIGEYTGADLADVLSSKPVWKEQDVRENFQNPTYEHSSDTVEDRLRRIIGNAGGDEEVDFYSTSMADLTYAVRKDLFSDINHEFGIEISADLFDDDDTLLSDLLDHISDRIYEENDLSSSNDWDDEEDINDEPLEDEIETTTPPPVEVIISSPTRAVEADDTIVVHVYPVVNGNMTRWVAECPTCDDGRGWKQDYARKRDIRRGVARVFGEDQKVTFVERT